MPKAYWIEVQRPNPDGGPPIWRGDVITPTEDQDVADMAFKVSKRTLYGDREFAEGENLIVRLVSADFSSDGEISNYEVIK